MPSSPAGSPHRASRAERIIGTMAATVVGLSVLAILAVFIAQAAGVDTGSGVWVVIALLPLVGLPIGFLLIVAFLIANAVARSRRARADG